MNLHTIRTSVSHFMWTIVYSRRGQIGPRYGPSYHIYEVERRTPPAIEGYMRRNWNPWNDGYWQMYPLKMVTPIRPLEPLCGRIKSSAREVRITHYNNDDTPWSHCQNCARIARDRGIHVKGAYAATMEDPWQGVPQTTRAMIGSDPVTGL